MLHDFPGLFNLSTGLFSLGLGTFSIQYDLIPHYLLFILSMFTSCIEYLRVHAFMGTTFIKMIVFLLYICNDDNWS